jgi:hypothetical protein
MSARFRKNRKDAVHQEIVDGLRARGIVVYDMPSPGDVLTCVIGKHEYVQTYGVEPMRPPCRWIPMEFKSPNSIRHKAKGAEGELVSNNKPREPKLIPIVHSLAEALALHGMTE